MKIIRKGPQIVPQDPDILLWHYTSSKVLWKILSGEFYATHYRYLNDASEICYGINACREYFQKEEKRVPYAENIVKNIECQDFFLFCFSEEADNLYQWRSYTPQGGFSLGFSYNELIKIIGTYESGNEDEKFLEFNFLKCKYDTPTIVKREIKDFICNLQKELDSYFERSCFFSNAGSDCTQDNDFRFDGDFNKKFDAEASKKINENPQYLRDVFSAFILTMLIKNICPAFKNPSFHFEHEHRLIITGASLRPDIELIDGKPRIQIKLPDLQKCIKSIYVSPHGDVNRNYLLAEIAKEKFNLDFEIRRSQSSFNGK